MCISEIFSIFTVAYGASTCRIMSLSKYQVNLKDLKRAEFVFKCGINFTIPIKKDPNFLVLCQILVSLLNGCGGIIYITSHDGQILSPGQLDKWQKDLDDALTFLPQKVKYLCCKLINWQSSVKILVTKSPEPITLSSNMDTRFSAKNRRVVDADNIRAIISQQAVTLQPLRLPATFTLGQIFPNNESNNLEFKEWTIKHVSDYMTKFVHKSNSRAILAMPNIEGGGDIFLGVKETSGHNIVVGVVLSESDEDEFKSLFQRFLEEDPSDKEPRIWGKQGTVPREGSAWTVYFYPVIDHHATDRKVLIHLHINQFQGGVFERKPVTYTISDTGTPMELLFDEWLSLISHGLINNMTTTTNHAGSFEQLNPLQPGSSKQLGPDISTQPEISQMPGVLTNLSVPHSMSAQLLVTYSDPHPGPRLPSRVRKKQYATAPRLPMTYMSKNASARSYKKKGISERDISKGVSKLTKLSWTSHTNDWERNLQHDPINCADNINDLAHTSTLLQTSNPLNVTPGIDTICSAIGKATEIRNVFQCIHEHMNCNEGFAFASDSFILNIEHDIKLHKPLGHMFDVLGVEINGVVHLCSVARRCVDQTKRDELWAYLMQSGRVLKLKMMTCLPPNMPDRLTDIPIQCHLLSLDGLYEKHTKADPGKQSQPHQLEMMQRILATLFLGRNTYIKTALGDDYTIHLTSKQMQCILEADCVRFNIIEGAPGSGKSFLAYYICGRYQNHNTIYVSSTEPYHKLLEHLNICIPLLIETDQDLNDAIEDGVFYGKLCIIIDDGHNFNCTKPTWVKLFDIIRINRIVKVFLMMDTSFQNYTTSPIDLKSCMTQYCHKHDIACQIKPLTTVHRNCRKVVSFIKCNSSEIRECGSEEISCSHHIDGDDVEIRKVDKLRCDNADNSLVALVRELSDSAAILRGEHNIYQPTDLAVLVDTPTVERDVEFFRKSLENHYPECRPQDASLYPVRGVRVEKLNNFMGIDAKVCICIPRMKTGKSKSKSNFTNPKYRNYIASRGIFKVIFLTEEELDSDAAHHMQLDDPPYIQSR